MPKNEISIPDYRLDIEKNPPVENEYQYAQAFQHNTEDKYWQRLKVGAPVVLTEIGLRTMPEFSPESKLTVVLSSVLDGEYEYEAVDENNKRHCFNYFDIELDPEVKTQLSNIKKQVA